MTMVTATAMESLLRTSSATTLAPNLRNLVVGQGLFRTNFFPGKSRIGLSNSVRRNAVIAMAKSKKKTHSFDVKPDEITGPFPEAVLLKERKVQEDGQLLPDFADDEERELYEFLNLEFESELNEDRVRHYEVVYLIHEKHDEEVEKVNEKVQDFLREKKGRVWRFNDWGLRRLAYPIKKANKAHYILMNYEMEARWTDEFKTLLDKDERVIRHLVMKRDKAITEDCPPPPEWDTLRPGYEEGDDEVYEDEDDEDWDDEEEIEGDGDDDEEEVIITGSKNDNKEDRTSKFSKPERVAR